MFSTPPLSPRSVPRRMVAPATAATNRPYLAANASMIPRRVSGGNLRNAGNTTRWAVIAEPNQKMPASMCSHCSTIRTQSKLFRGNSTALREPDQKATGLDSHHVHRALADGRAVIELSSLSEVRIQFDGTISDIAYRSG